MWLHVLILLYVFNAVDCNKYFIIYCCIYLFIDFELYEKCYRYKLFYKHFTNCWYGILHLNFLKTKTNKIDKRKKETQICFASKPSPCASLSASNVGRLPLLLNPFAVKQANILLFKMYSFYRNKGNYIYIYIWYD